MQERKISVVIDCLVLPESNKIRGEGASSFRNAAASSAAPSSRTFGDDGTKRRKRSLVGREEQIKQKMKEKLREQEKESAQTQ